MNKIIVLLIITCCLCLTATTMAQKANNKQQLLRHVVLLKFKDSTSAPNIKKVETAFRSLPPKIAVIKDFEWGINNSPEKLNDGFTHCFFVSFKSEADRAAYLPHAAHLVFVEVLKPYLDKVLVIDYWSEQ